MDDTRLRHLLTEATEGEPALGAVVERAMRAGLRIRRRRRVAGAAGSVAAVVLVAMIPSLGRAVAPPRPGLSQHQPARHQLVPSPAGRLFVASQLGMFTVTLPSGQVGPLMTDHYAPAGGSQYFLPYRDTVYDYDSAARLIDVFNAATGKLAKSIRLGKTEYGAPYGTDPMAITPDGRILYVPDDETASIIPVNTVTGSAGKPIPVGSAPVAVVMSPDGSTAYALGDSGTVTAISTATGTAGKPIYLHQPGYAQSESSLNSQPIVISPDGSTLYMLYVGPDLLLPVHTATGKAGAPIKLGSEQFGALGIAFSPDGSTAYVANGNTIVPVQVATGQAGSPISVSCSSIVVAPDGKSAYALDESQPGSLTRVNLVTGKAGPQVPAMGQPLLSMTMSPDGSTIYVSRNHALVVVSTTTSRQERLIRLPVADYAYVVEYGQ
jgi:DNA-binding beta-propeller fold protein YncE